jgi:hydrogenase maturation protease
MTAEGGDVLVIGYGNPGRMDDGLGPALVEALEKLAIEGVDLDADYQLIVEDAAAVAAHKVVVFADAAETGPEPFYLRPVEPKGELGFSSHGCQPGQIMALAQELFRAETKGYILGIRGYEFNEFREALSEKAKANLAAATEFIVKVIQGRDFEAAAQEEKDYRRDAESRRTEEKEEAFEGDYMD